MLDTRFPRFLGDIGNRDSWPFDVVFKVVNGASAHNVVTATASQNLQPFINAALELEQQGVSAITTSCGFLCLAQVKIAAHLKVPFIASSLVQQPWIQAMLPPNKKAGILTIDSTAITTAHLLSAGIEPSVLIKGTENGNEFTRSILEGASDMDQQRCEQDNVTAARQFVNEHPELGALVLECTNMAPYATAINQATGLPVYSIYTLICWLQAGLLPRNFTPG